MKKRILSLALAFFLVAALLPPMRASAAEVPQIGAIKTISAGPYGYLLIKQDGTVYAHQKYFEHGTAIVSTPELKGAVSVCVPTYRSFGSAPMEISIGAIMTDGSLKLSSGTGEWESWNETPYYRASEHIISVAIDASFYFSITEDYAFEDRGLKIADDVIAVSTSNFMDAYIKSDHTLWQYGGYANGIMGGGKIMDDVAAVSIGVDHAAVIKLDGSLWLWGDNTAGQIGNGGAYDQSEFDEQEDFDTGEVYYNTFLKQTAPVKVMDDVAAVSCGYRCTAAIKKDGSLWMWGGNVGALGNKGGNDDPVTIYRTTSQGIAYDRYDPVQNVPAKVMDNVADVDLDDYALILKKDSTLWYAEQDWSSGELTLKQVADGVALPVRTPAYRYPAADPAADTTAKSASEAAGGGDSSTVYTLADGLYYVLVEKDSSTTGAVVKGVKEKGAVVWMVIQTHEEPATQEELDQLVAQEQSTPNLSLDFGKLASLSTAGEVAEYLQDRLDNLDGLTVNDPAKSELALFLENAMASLASAPVSGPGNRLTVSAGTVSKLASQAQSAKAQLDELLTRNGITLNKELEILLRVLWPDVDGTAPCQVTLDRDLVNGLGGNSLRILLGDDRHTIQLPADTVSGLLEQYGTLSIQMSQSGENTYTINFLDSTGTVLEQISLPVMIGLPASGPLNTIMVSYANGSDNWGGQYDESTRSITFETRYSGQYEVLENDVAISDIGDLDQELQTAIKFLVSKGYMNAPDGVFSPENPLSRYDFTQALVGMFFALDRSLESSFPDVPQDSAYYSYVASAEADDIVKGFDDGTFSGEKNITVEQMLALAARTLRERKGYLPPENEDSYLSSFADVDQIAGWAKQLVAQTVRDEIMDRANALNPQSEVSRAQAALILYRLFLRLYEVSPVALELPEVLETEPPTTEAPGPSESNAGGFPVGPVAAVIAGVAVVGGGVGAGLYFSKKKNQK